MRKLLLADDSVTIQRVIELTFSGEDIQVVAVNDGEQAIARIPAELPDVVLADIGMPRKGGYDVAAFVKGRPDLSHIPVLLLAGAFEPVDQTRAEQVGADGVLIKPFEPRQVIERVKELLAAVRPTIRGEVVPEPAVPVVATRVAAAAATPETAVGARPHQTIPADAPVASLPVAIAPEPAVPAPAEAEVPPVQSLDDLFESLNQALTGRTGTPPAAATAPKPAVATRPSTEEMPAVTPPVPFPTTFEGQRAQHAPEPAAASPSVKPPPAALPPLVTPLWPTERPWLTPTRGDASHAMNGVDSVAPDSVAPGSVSTDSVFTDNAFPDSVSFERAGSPATSASTLDDYFDRLSAAFSHTRPTGPQVSLPDRVEDYTNGPPAEPPAASYEWLPQPREPRGLMAFENGEGEDNPILSAVSTLMARAQSDTTPGTETLAGRTSDGRAASPELTNARAVSGPAAPPADLADVITERVLARLVPELTENLRRLVQQEISRTR